MALVLKDRVRETSTTTGTGSFTLGGTSTGFQSFSVIGDGNTTYYGIVNSAAGEWEVGVGTYTASGTVLSRDTILESSNGGSAVNFSAGTKDVFVTYPAERSASTDTFASPPAIGSTTPAAGTFTTLTATGQTSLGGVAGSESLRVNSVVSAVNWVEVSGDSSVYPSVKSSGAGSSVELRLSSKGNGAVSFFTNNLAQRQMQVTHTDSAVNYVRVTGAATGASPVISAQGSDSNISLFLNAKGTGNVFLQVGGANVFQAAGSSTSANRILIQANNSGTAPAIQSVGSDTNIDLTLTPKGTGVVKTSSTGLQLVGSSSGYVGLKGAAAAGSTTYTLPAADGSSGQALTTNGTGTLSWSSAGGGATGVSGQVFTSGGTFTIPSGVTAVKVTVVGGGGGGGSSSGTYYSGGGGGSGGAAITYLTGLTPSATLAVAIGAAGAAGATGGTSTVSSGTQSISTISATGGGAGGTGAGTAGGAGGSASGGSFNLGGGSGTASMYATGYVYGTGGNGGNSILGGGAGGSTYATAGRAGATNSGGGGSGAGGGGGGSGGAGGSGVVIFEW